MKNFQRIVSLIFLFFSIILIIYIYYQSEIIWNGLKFDYYFQFYVFCFILIILSIISFFLPKKFFNYSLLYLSIIIITIYCFEIYLTLSNNKLNNIDYKKKIYFEKTAKNYDSRRKIDVYESLIKIHENTSIKVSPANYLNNKNLEIFPFSGKSNSKTIYGNENGYYFIFDSDRYGFNNPDDQWNKKEIEYLITGDSYAFGCCVNRPDDIASVIRKKTNSGVLNLAYSHNSPLIEYAVLREYSKIKDVKNIIWIFFEGNDIEGLHNEILNPILMNYLIDKDFSQNLSNRQNKIDVIVDSQIKKALKKEKNRIKKKVQNNFFNKSRILNFIKLNNARLSIQPQQPEFHPLPQKEFVQILKLTKELSVFNNSKLFFVYLPEYQRYRFSKYSNRNYNKIIEILENLEIDYIDIHKKVFQKQDNPLSLFSFGLPGNHYNEKGYHLTAETILEYINNDQN